MTNIDKKFSDNIEIKGCRVHNLKNVDIAIPRDQLVVITGVSGSGKSSLAFDTIFAEGQRRYVESLSAYARQFLGRMNKPEVDFINGIPPAIAIEQKVNTRNPRSTVGTSTEIYEYLRLLYARIGKTYSPVSGNLVTRHTVSTVVDFLCSQPEGTKCMLLAPISPMSGIPLSERFKSFLSEGFTRLANGNKVYNIDELMADTKQTAKLKNPCLVIDRFSVQTDQDTQSRYADSIQTAFKEGNERCIVYIYEADGAVTERTFSDRFELDGMEFTEPTEHLFSFNNPIGACPLCEGYGKVLGIDADLVVPDQSLSLYNDAVSCWKGETFSYWKTAIINAAARKNISVHKPWYELSESEKAFLWKGDSRFEGINGFFEYLEAKKFKIQNRILLARFRGKTTCPECLGTRLRKEAGYVKVDGNDIASLVDLPIYKLKLFFDSIALDEHEHKVAGRLLIEICNRIAYMTEVGLGYLTLNRLSASLSGGESQRINLATSLGSNLTGSLYILDEPSIGLHPRDTKLLIGILKKLQNLGNSVLVVEHDEEIMRAANQLIDIGPEAGTHGGRIVFRGNHAQLDEASESLTAAYLKGRMSIPVPPTRRHWNQFIEVSGAREHNLKNISVKLPLNTLTVITGVSGSGKTTLVRSILYPALSKAINSFGEKPGQFGKLGGQINSIRQLEFVDQNPIGKSSRSNPVTYIKAYDEIRKLYALQPAAKISGFTPSHFSFNVEGGRCEQCQGEGVIKVEMQFMADVFLVCENCQGKRFKQDVLDVQYRSKSIFDILEMTVDEAIDFFESSGKPTEQKIGHKLKPLQDVGLGYVKLGQSSSTLSGGESQRVKLASFLAGDHSDKPTLLSSTSQQPACTFTTSVSC